jgi:hypothetical protein
MDELPNSPLKLPFFEIGLVVCAGGAAGPAVAGRWVWTAALILGGALSVPAIRVIRQGRNPWWIRSPLDRRWH